MLIAQKKRKENIVEYLLYMWQVEDLIRANNLDINKIKDNVIARYNQPEETTRQIKEWYERLIEMMREEGVKQSGHIHLVTHVLHEVQEVHSKLLANKDKEYLQQYQKNTGNIQALRDKMKNKDAADIEVILTGLYGIVLMRMQGKTITDETEAAVKSLSNLMQLLARKFKAYESGKLELK